MQYLYIFVGGALGALIRFCLSMLNEGSTFPLGTFVANLLGAFFNHNKKSTFYPRQKVLERSLIITFKSILASVGYCFKLLITPTVLGKIITSINITALV